MCTVPLRCLVDSFKALWEAKNVHHPSFEFKHTTTAKSHEFTSTLVPTHPLSGNLFHHSGHSIDIAHAGVLKMLKHPLNNSAPASSEGEINASAFAPVSAAHRAQSSPTPDALDTGDEREDTSVSNKGRWTPQEVCNASIVWTCKCPGSVIHAPRYSSC